MKFLRRITSLSNFWPLVLVVFLGVLAGRVLLTSGYFNMHDDLQMMRQLEMEKCWQDFQIPCRWVPDMGYGYGFPLFNYYPPLPYLVGQVIRLTGVSFITTVKLTFFLSFVLSAVTMYILAREFWGRLGGVLSSVFYVWAPYHAVDVYVRGAMNEAWALVWFPLILWVSYRLITEERVLPRDVTGPAARSSQPTSSFRVLSELAGARWDSLRSRHPSYTFKWIVILALSWTALLLSHNIMVLIFTPVFAGWCLLWLWRKYAWSRIPQLMISGIWAAGLASFSSIPVLLEQKLVHVDTLTRGYYEYIAHFADINQLFFSRFWGYGPSVWGEGDGMSFQIGHIHWILALVIATLSAAVFLRKQKILPNLLLIISYLLVIGFAAAFMAHVRSTPIWLSLPFLSIVQFPWRFLTIVILSFSFVIGALAVLLNVRSRWTLVLVIILLVAVVLFNNDYFKPDRMGPLSDEEKFRGAAWELQQTAGIYDYLPKTARIAPQGPRLTPVDVVEGEVAIDEVEEGTNWIRFKVRVDSDPPAASERSSGGLGEGKVRINIFQFPNWRVFIDGEETEITGDNDELGRMHITIPEGEHEIYAKLYNTFPRTAGNLISLVSWGILLTLPWWRKRVSRARM